MSIRNSSNIQHTMDAVSVPSIIEEIRSARNQEYSSHYRVIEGGNIDKYTAETALGSGRFATVWKANNNAGSKKVAIKVYRCGRTNQEYWRNEVKILNIITEKIALAGIVPPLIKYHGTFAIVHFDDLLEPNIHPCILFDLAGDSVSQLLKFCKHEYSAGVPIECSKKIIRDALRGLEFLHSAGLIHTDIKPSNILLDRSIDSIDGLNFTALIGDFGSTTPSDNLFSMHVGTDEYIAPELLLERKYTSAIDIWALFVTAFELITGDKLFDIYKEGGIIYGSDVDEEALEGILSEDSDSAPELIDAAGEVCGGCDGGCEKCCRMDTSGDESSSGSEDPEKLALIAYRHLLLMEKVLGPPGRSFTKSARNFYNARGKLKNNPNVSHKPISKIMIDNYDIAHAECTAFEWFLLRGLQYNPADRISATDALQLQWID